MTEKLVRLTAEHRANFVAYLDGELEEQQTREVEQMLTQSAVARHDLELLAATWEMLDVLPRVQASEDFSQKTMATLQLESRKPVLNVQPWILQTKRLALLLGGWLVVLLCGVVGFVAARSFPATEADQLIYNYPLIQQLDRYQEIESAQFLEHLQRSREWASHQTAKERAGQ